MKHVIIRLAAVTMVMMLLASCGSSRKAVSDAGAGTTEQALFGSAVNASYKYEALQSKVRVTLGRTTLSGKMCLESGKRFGITVNAPLIGFEVGRVEATPKEVLVVDKYDKVFCRMPLAQLPIPGAVAGREMEALECLMLGRIFIPGRGQATLKDFGRLQWTSDADGRGATGVCEIDGHKLSYHIAANGMLDATTFTSADGRQVVLTYTDWQAVGKEAQQVSSSESVSLTSGSGKKTTVGMRMTSPSFGASSWTPFTPSSSYREVTLDELMSTLKKVIP